MWENKSGQWKQFFRRGAEAGRGTGKQGVHRSTRLEKWHVACKQGGGRGLQGPKLALGNEEKIGDARSS